MKRLFYSFGILLLFAGCSSTSSPSGNKGNSTNSSGKQQISGTVKSATTDSVLPGAWVTLSKPDSMGTASDSHGAFKFDSVPAGTYSVQATLIGYSSDMESVEVDSGTNAAVTLKLSPIAQAKDTTLICLYRFANNANDSSGNGHDGNLHGCTFVTDRFGRPNGSLHLTPTSDVMIVPDAPDLNFKAGSDFSICAWVKVDTLWYSTGDIIQKTAQSGSELGYNFYMEDYAPELNISTTAGTGSNFGDQIQDAQWHFHVLLISASTGYVTFWVDNQDDIPKLQNSISGDMTNTSPLLIGQNFNGAVDDIRMYRGTLTPHQIDSLYHEND